MIFIRSIWIKMVFIIYITMKVQSEIDYSVISSYV